MQLTRKTSFWKYLLFPVAAVMVVGFAVVPRPAPPMSYRRYTSPPFPDGVRYTFLYPVTWNNVYSGSTPAHFKGNLLQLVIISKKEGHWPGASLWHRWIKPEEDAISVVVEKPTTKPLRSSRAERQSTNRVEIRHTVLVDDPRAHEHFIFRHIDSFGTASFTQHDRVVTNSFRVLLPGEPVPAP